MAEQDSSEEKTEAPSDKRRQETREKGSVAKSTEVNSVIVLLVSIYMLKWFGPWILKELENALIEYILLIKNTEMSDEQILKLTVDSFILLGKLMLPISGVIMVFGVIANIIQVGFLWTLKPLMPKFEKINPIEGTKRLFSMRSLVETLKSILKFTIIGWVAYITISNDFGKMIQLADASITTIWSYTLDLSFKIILRIALVLIIIAILDYAYQRYDHEKKLKMTKQELKEERKQMDGDPQVKSRIRSLQREMARRRMMEQIPKATVVVTNPTHIAIAIRYEPTENETPVVIAKGKRIIAERIKQLAKDAGIPIIEDKPLARSMYDRVVVGDPIPVEFFNAVAEILAYVYRLKNRRAA